MINYTRYWLYLALDWCPVTTLERTTNMISINKKKQKNHENKNTIVQF